MNSIARAFAPAEIPKPAAESAPVAGEKPPAFEILDGDGSHSLE